MPNAAAGLLQVDANPSASLVSGSARAVRRSCIYDFYGRRIVP